MSEPELYLFQQIAQEVIKNYVVLFASYKCIMQEVRTMT
jgi:hypothetical protein